MMKLMHTAAPSRRRSVSQTGFFSWMCAPLFLNTEKKGLLKQKRGMI